jgi:HNH endonuclease
MSRLCSVPGCQEIHDAKGFCHKHYNKWKRRGDPLAAELKGPAGNGHIQRGYRVHGSNGKRIAEHRLIVERILGKPLPPGAVVHHVDENRLNNDPANLVVCPSNKYHQLIHQRMNAYAATGNPNWRKCPYCGKYDDPANMRSEKSGRCVHRECSAAARRIATAKRRNRVDHVQKSG